MKIKKRSKTQLKNNARFQALILLDQIEHEKGYSNVLINQFLKQSNLEDRDNRLIVQLVYGVVQRRYTLNYYLAPFIKNKAIDPWVETLLRMSVFQFEYLDRIPAHAVINESVQIAKTNGHQGLGNFVNAILRSIQRKGLPTIEAIEDPIGRMSVEYSVEPWIIEEILALRTREETESILQSLLADAYVSARLVGNPNQREDLLAELNDQEYEVEPSPISAYGIRSREGNLIHSKAFKEGRITIQDESAMLVTPVGKIAGHEAILDACAAPGGKTTHMAQLLTTGHVTGLDVSSAKLEKVSEHAERMQLQDKITLHVADATKFKPENGQLYDKIYVDAPCSGLGLMRRKPEIKYEKSKDDVKELQAIQLDILNYVTTLLKPKGQIIYSTCTITESENEHVIDKLLNQQPNLQHDPIKNQELEQANLLTDEGNVRIWPDQYNTDGFFISRLQKN